MDIQNWDAYCKQHCASHSDLPDVVGMANVSKTLKDTKPMFNRDLVVNELRRVADTAVQLGDYREAINISRTIKGLPYQYKYLNGQAYADVMTSVLMNKMNLNMRQATKKLKESEHWFANPKGAFGQDKGGWTLDPNRTDQYGRPMKRLYDENGAFTDSYGIMTQDDIKRALPYIKKHHLTGDVHEWVQRYIARQEAAGHHKREEHDVVGREDDSMPAMQGTDPDDMDDTEGLDALNKDLDEEEEAGENISINVEAESTDPIQQARESQGEARGSEGATGGEEPTRSGAEKADDFIGDLLEQQDSDRQATQRHNENAERAREAYAKMNQANAERETFNSGFDLMGHGGREGQGVPRYRYEGYATIDDWYKARTAEGGSDYQQRVMGGDPNLQDADMRKYREQLISRQEGRTTHAFHTGDIQGREAGERPRPSQAEQEAVDALHGAADNLDQGERGGDGREARGRSWGSGSGGGEG